MTQTQHTPRPWRNEGKFVVATRPDPHGPDTLIATIAQDDRDGRIASPEQQESNRRLIAAAPDLLKSLADVLEAVRSQADCFSICEEIYDGPAGAAAQKIIARLNS